MSRTMPSIPPRQTNHNADRAFWLGPASSHSIPSATAEPPDDARPYAVVSRPGVLLPHRPAGEIVEARNR